MDFYSHLLFQLDEARRYIEDGRLQHLRVALLLLDNSAELQMDRRIKSDLRNDEMRERTRNQLLALPKGSSLSTHLQELIEWTPLTAKQKRDLDRDFNQKVAYMVGRGDHLSLDVAGPLRHLHKYRNEAYHSGSIRPETIRTAALLLLEINCRMLLEVGRSRTSYSSDEDYSWIQQRFHLDKTFFGRLPLGDMVSEIRSGLFPTDKVIAETLADHLRDRFLALYESLDFIVENGGRNLDREQALREVQLFGLQTQLITGCKYSMNSLELLESTISAVRGENDRIKAFHLFANIESELEPIEESVNGLVRESDFAIQLAIDEARGK
jgi:hypothetical protein